MAESYSTSLRLTLIGDGDLSGTWGDVTNANIGTLLEEAICGVISVPMGDTNYTLQSLNGVKDQARAAVIVATGANTAVRQVIAPLVPKLYILNNSTTGGYNVTIGGSTGSVVTVPAGQSALVYCDGTNFYNGITVAASAATTLGGGAANQILYQASTSNTQFITAPTTANSFLYWTGSSFSWSTISATLTVGVSAISGGTSGYILYNNGGVLGNSATTGSGTVVLNNSPSFTGTPTFASAPTVGGYSVLTTNTGVSAGGNNNFTGTNTFSSAPTISGASVLTTSTGAQLSGTNNFTGTNNYNTSSVIVMTGSNAGDQRLSVVNGANTAGLSSTSLQIGTGGNGFVYDSSPQISVLVSGGAQASFRTTGNYQASNSPNWATTSDINIKTNLHPITGVLDKINALNPIHFEYKDKIGETQTGFIAQEFETVFPGHTIETSVTENYKQFVPEGQTTIKALDLNLTAYLVKAIQELSKKVTDLEEQVLNLGVK